MKLSGIYYLILLGILCLGLWFIFLRESSSQTEMVFDDSNEAGVERLCIPIKLKVADSLFLHPLGNKGGFETDIKKNLFIVKGKTLMSVLSSAKMGEDVFYEFHDKFDKENPIVTLEDESTLTFRIDKDETTGEEYINVPAGLLRAYIK